MVGNKRGKKEKRKEKSVGTCVEEKKRGKRKGRRAHVCGEKKKKLYHNIFTIFSQ